jgi:FkbM family methyltransferase
MYSRLLARDALCFDIGANIGETSEAMLKAGARVVAFEPNPEVRAELRARCGHHERWVMVEAALGRESAVARLYSRENHGQSGLSRDWGGSRINATHFVPVVTLDAAIETFGLPFYCKIDTEGWELPVLQGLTQCIPMLSFEFHLNERGIGATHQCLQWLSSLGFDRVNLVPAEDSTFHFTEWVPINTFNQWFPGDLIDSLPGDTYGDIYVQSDAAAGNCRSELRST